MYFGPRKHAEKGQETIKKALENRGDRADELLIYLQAFYAKQGRHFYQDMASSSVSSKKPENSFECWTRRWSHPGNARGATKTEVTTEIALMTMIFAMTVIFWRWKNCCNNAKMEQFRIKVKVLRLDPKTWWQYAFSIKGVLKWLSTAFADPKT